MGTYVTFDPADIVAGNPTQVTVGLWSGDTGSLTAIYSSSTEASTSLQGQYYWDAYQANPANTSVVPIPAIQFSVTYGNRNGGGAPTLNQNDNATLSTKAIYSQYRNLLLDPGELQFVFASNYASDHIYVINIARAQLRQQMDPGNWSLQLSGSNGIHTFIDDSGQTLDANVGKGGNIFNVVSGSLTGPSGSTVVASQSVNWGGYGLFYPSVGIIVFNPNAISESVGFVSGGFYTSGSAPFAAVTGSNTAHQYNHAGFFNSINLGGDFQARSAETISSTNYFVRARNQNFNYSNNPTFYDQTNGTLIYNDFVNDPQVYVTTIGLYDDNNELLAVAKLSRPTLKSFSSEINCRVRLDW